MNLAVAQKSAAKGKTDTPPMTRPRVEAALRRLDRTINRAEARPHELAPTDLCTLILLKRLHTELKLLLIARDLESMKKVVSLDRWRHGFGAGGASEEQSQERVDARRNTGK